MKNSSMVGAPPATVGELGCRIHLDQLDTPRPRRLHRRCSQSTDDETISSVIQNTRRPFTGRTDRYGPRSRRCQSRETRARPIRRALRPVWFKPIMRATIGWLAACPHHACPECVYVQPTQQACRSVQKPIRDQEDAINRRDTPWRTASSNRPTARGLSIAFGERAPR